MNNLHSRLKGFVKRCLRWDVAGVMLFRDGQNSFYRQKTRPSIPRKITEDH